MKFYAIDIFAGCGGVSEGFTQAGFNLIVRIEMDRWACETLSTRCLYYKLKDRGRLSLYFKYLRGEKTKEEIYKRFPDIEKEIQLEIIKAEFGKDSLKKILERIEAARIYHNAPKFHILLGGPPCQPYSLAGRGRDPERMLNDGRHFLYAHYLEILENLKPDFFIFENVPGLISANAAGEEIFHKILRDFSEVNPSYEIAPSIKELYENPNEFILNSAEFNVPQRRKRIFLIGYRKNLFLKRSSVRKIFQNIQKVGLRNKKNKVVLTVRDAIGDIPSLKPSEGNDSWYGSYNEEQELTIYQIQMRRDSPGILNHKARTHMESDLKRYKFFIEHRKGGSQAANINDLMKEKPSLIPKHRHLDKFLDRFKVQWWTRPSSTITAHICKDGHYYIHPDIHQCRSFTVREAARCQSFPDNFRFEGPRTEQFRQVGNAVPPLLARTIALFILRELKKTYER